MNLIIPILLLKIIQGTFGLMLKRNHIYVQVASSYHWNVNLNAIREFTKGNTHLNVKNVENNFYKVSM